MKNLIILFALLFSATLFAQNAPQSVMVQKEKDYHYFIITSNYAPGEVTFDITSEDGENVNNSESVYAGQINGIYYYHYPYRTKGKRRTYYVTATHNGIESEPIEADWIR